MLGLRRSAAVPRGPLTVPAGAVLACILLASAYAILSVADVVPMTVPIFVAWLAWLQLVHGIAAWRLWPQRAQFSPRLQTGLLSWGGLAFWYWLPAPIYFVLTMNMDELQLTWTALAFFWEVPVVGGVFLLVVQRLFPWRRRQQDGRDPARLYRDVLRYPTVVAVLTFTFTLAGYGIGTLQLRLFADEPFVEQIKNLAHGLVISLLLAVYYHLALDRVLEPVRARIAREFGLGTVVARTVTGRILGVSLAVTVSGFALISLFVLQGFQGMVADNTAAMVRRDLAVLAATSKPRLDEFHGWGERGRVFVLHAGATLPAAEFSPATRRLVGGHGIVVAHDSRRDLKIVGAVDTPWLGGRLVGVAYLTDAYGPLQAAARLLGIAGGCVLVVTVGMLIFASRASTQAVRALSSAVRRVEAGDVDAAMLRIETGDEIGELSAVVERYVRQSRDLQANLEHNVREKTRELSDRLEEIQRADAALRRSAQRLEALQSIDRSILAAESADAIARAAMPRLRRIVPCRWGAMLLFEAEQGLARVMLMDGTGGPPEGSVMPIGELPSAEVLQSKGVRYLDDLAARRRCFPVFRRLLTDGTRSLISVPLVASGETIGLLCVGSEEPAGFDDGHREIVGEVANQLAVAIHEARLREALDLQQRRLHAVVEHLPEGVLLLERGGRVALANPFARLHLPALAEIAASGEVTAVAGISMEQLLAVPETEPREVVVADERPGVFQVAARRLDGPGATVGCVVVVRDVTRERASQRAAQQQARLAAVGQLAAGIAHDFNNILLTIIASAELAERRYDERAFVDVRLTTIREQGERAAALVRQILDFSRQSPPSLQTVDLGGLVQDTLALLERTLPETIRIVFETVPGRLIVSADPNQLSQVLTNLAVNARDAMPRGGELRVRLACDRRRPPGDGAAGPEEWVVLSVADTGAGMPPEVRERVFEPFFTTKGPGRGTGLGLSQAYGILEQHGGHITVDSEPGRGTTFTIRLPALAVGTPATSEQDEPALRQGAGEMLLVVEDESAVRETLAEMLRELNYQVLSASCAEEALELHREHADVIALVLTDLVMPGVGGLGLLRTLRERKSRVPIVMMSGYLGEHGREPVPGVVAWVQKPVTARRLGQVLHETLARSQPAE